MGAKTLAELPVAGAIAGSDIYHSQQSGTDVQTSASALAAWILEQSPEAGTVQLVTTTTTLSNSPPRNLNVLAVLASAGYTISLPSVSAAGIPMRVVVVYSGTSSYQLSIAGLANNGGSVNLYNNGDCAVIEAIQTGVGTYGWQLVSTLIGDIVSSSASSYTVSAGDAARAYIFTTGTNVVPVNLPAASSMVGKTLTFGKIDSGSGSAVLTPNGGDTISGMSTIPLTDPSDVAIIKAVASGVWLLVQPPIISNARQRSQARKAVGELFYLDDYQAPTPWTYATQFAHFPAICLSALNPGATVISSAGASGGFNALPLLVPHLRNKPVAYLRGNSGEVNSYTLASYAQSTTVITLVFASATATQAFVNALAEDYLDWHARGYTDASWGLTLTLPALGAIAAGEYLILPTSGTGINTTTLTITLTSGTSQTITTTVSSATVQCYPHRIPGSSTTANIYSIAGRVLFAANDQKNIAAGTQNYYVGGTRRRTHIAGHIHTTGTQQLYVVNGSSNGNTTTGGTGQGYVVSTTGPAVDGTNPTPLPGNVSEPDSYAAQLYIWAGQY